MSSEILAFPSPRMKWVDSKVEQRKGPYLHGSDGSTDRRSPKESNT